MLGNYVLHYALTDFAVGLLVIAAMIEVGRLVLRRPQWQVAVDLLLLLGFGGALVSVGSGLWLVAAQDHGHSKTLTIHHWFAYSTLGVAAVAVLAHFLARRRPKLAGLKTVALVISAGLVSGAGFFGGKMSHPPTEVTPHSHDGSMTTPAPQPGHDMPPPPPMGDAGMAAPASDATPLGSATPTKPPPGHKDDHPH